MNSTKQQQSSALSASQSQSSSCATPASAKSSHDSIARRAYDIYIATGRKQGQCGQNWRQAESELNNAANAASEGPREMVKNYDDVMPSGTLAGGIAAQQPGRGVKR